MNIWRKDGNMEIFKTERGEIKRFQTKDRMTKYAERFNRLRYLFTQNMIGNQVFKSVPYYRLNEPPHNMPQYMP